VAEGTDRPKVAQGPEKDGVVIIESGPSEIHFRRVGKNEVKPILSKRFDRERAEDERDLRIPDCYFLPARNLAKSVFASREKRQKQKQKKIQEKSLQGKLI